MKTSSVTRSGDIWWRYFISPVGVSSGGTPWVDRRSAFVTTFTSGIGGGQSAGHMIGRLGATRATSVLLPRSIKK